MHASTLVKMGPIRSESCNHYRFVLFHVASVAVRRRCARIDVPTAPERPLITSFTSRSMNLSWAHSQESRNAPVTHFLIETRRVQSFDSVHSFRTRKNDSCMCIYALRSPNENRIGENGPWNEVPQINTYSNATTYQVTGLTPFTVYSFRLRAINKLGISPPSKESYYIVSLREGD